MKGRSGGVGKSWICGEGSGKGVLVEFRCRVVVYVSGVWIVFYFEVIN